MTASRKLNVGVVRNKLDAIERARQTLVAIDGLDTERLQNDSIVAAAVERLLCRLVDLASETNTHLASALLNRSPGGYRESFDLAREAGALAPELAQRLKPAVGMRNTIVHEYVTIDYSIVAAAVPMAIDGFAEYRRQVAAFVARHENS